MKRKLIIILYLIVFQNSYSQSISRSKKYSIFSKENIDLKFKTIFLESLIKKNNDDINGAINLTKECLSIYPNSFSANYEIANLYYDLKDYETSLFYAKSALKVIPDNFWVNNLLLKIYTELDDVPQILKTFKTILNIDYSIERKIKFAELNEYYSKPKSSIKIYNEIEKEIGVNEITSIKKQKLYINIGDIKSATKELKKLIDKFPNPTNLKNKSHLKIRNGRESIKFDDLEFSRIFMAWFVPNLNDQKNIIGLEILASILSVGRNSRLVKILKEDSNLVESVYVDVNAGELGGLFIMEASCESKDIDLVEKQINKTIDEISNCKALALDEIKKAINIVKSNYIFNLETSTQLSSFFGNELLWGRKSSINNLESHLKYWNDLDNFKEITEYIRGEKFTLVASPGKC